MIYILSGVSRRNLVGVHPRLVLVVEQAITLTAQDFQVHDGLRRLEEQRRNVARGVSATLDSKHLPQQDGFAHAVDLVPIRLGKLSWDWPGCVKIAFAVARTAQAFMIAIRWGGVWDREMADYAETEGGIRDACKAYVERRHSAGKTALLDGPHFELVDAQARNCEARKVMRSYPATAG